MNMVGVSNSLYNSKIVISQNFANSCKCILRVGMPCGCAGTFPRKEGGMQVLAGLAPSSQTTVYLLTTAWLEKIGKK
jgi:hypothetical protein